jgi:hypothetical protein
VDFQHLSSLEKGEIGAVHGPEIRWEYKDLMEIMKAGTVGG